MKGHQKHIIGWTTWITIAFILGVLVHVLVFAPLKDREFAQYALKSTEYLGIGEKYSKVDIPQETLDLIEPEMIVQDVLRRSVNEREEGLNRELYVQQQSPPEVDIQSVFDDGEEVLAMMTEMVELMPPDQAYNSMMGAVGSGVSGDATDIDVGNTTIQDHKKTLILKENPIVIEKVDVLHWHNKCNVDAAVAKHCYMVGWNGGEPHKSVIDVNEIIGNYYGGQYMTCWWVTELGQEDNANDYLPMDTDTIMMLIEESCHEE